MNRTLALRRTPWLWTLGGCVVLVAVVWGLSGRITGSTVTQTLGLAFFLTVASLGQMYVIAAGGGGIDLSIPGVLTMAAITDAALEPGYGVGAAVLAVGAVGFGVGLLNALLAVGAKVPPIVATLGTGFMLQSLEVLFYSQAERGTPGPALGAFVHAYAAAAPLLLWVGLAVVIVFELVLQLAVFGRWVEAVGQNRFAARSAGVRVAAVRSATFVLSGIMAAITGVMLAAYAGGVFLGMGDPYLLGSIAAVVIGGTLIAGGRATSLGTFLGAVFIGLLGTVIALTRLGAGGENIVEGLLLLAILAGRSLVDQ